MAKQNDSSVYQLENGNWGYRFTIMRNGQRKDVRRKQDDNGNPFTTRKAATKARQLALQQEQENSKPQPKERKTVAAVFTEYCEKGRSGKAYQTIRKQDSLWEIHLQRKFGKRFVDDISVAEVEDYLTNLYYKQKYSYRRPLLRPNNRPRIQNLPQYPLPVAVCSIVSYQKQREKGGMPAL